MYVVLWDVNLTLPLTVYNESLFNVTTGYDQTFTEADLSPNLFQLLVDSVNWSVFVGRVYDSVTFTNDSDNLSDSDPFPNYWYNWTWFQTTVGNPASYARFYNGGIFDDTVWFPCGPRRNLSGAGIPGPKQTGAGANHLINQNTSQIGLVINIIPAENAFTQFHPYIEIFYVDRIKVNIPVKITEQTTTDVNATEQASSTVKATEQAAKDVNMVEDSTVTVKATQTKEF